MLGITKAYTTRVGEGPFPTEDKGEMGERLGRVGKEFGTVTGRKRRCGWFDATLVRQTVRISGIDGIALTKLDVLDGLATIRDSRRLPPRQCAHSIIFRWTPAVQAAVEPVYEDDGRLAGLDGGGPHMERSARPGGQIRSPRRRADRRACGLTFDKSRA